jgi:hypothetical protein
MKKITDRKVIMGEFIVTSDGLAFCIFPDSQAKTACGALVYGEHEGFASEVVVASDCDKPITASDYLRVRCCASDLRDIEVDVTVKFRYTAPVMARESAFVFPKDFKCADFKFGDLRFIRGYRPIYEVFDEC